MNQIGNKENNGENLKTGIFGDKKSKPANSPVQRIKQPSIRNKASSGSTSDQEASKAASALAATSSIEDSKRQKEADEANKFSENDIRLVKESIFNGFCESVEDVKVIPGLVISVKMYSMSTNEYDFINQIVFDFRKESIDKKGSFTICPEKFDSLFTGLLLATQIVDINNIPVIKDEAKLNLVKTAIKSYSKLELLGITKDEDMEKLIKLKKELVNRAYAFMNMDNNYQAMLNTARIQFNSKVGNLLNKSELVKK